MSEQDIRQEADARALVPPGDHAEVLLAHGGGGKLSHELIQQMILPAFQNPLLAPLHDGAVFESGGVRFAFSTDSYVINPIFFPGGDIGELAVNGTVNDLAMCGSEPLYLSAAFIIEEGFPMKDLSRILGSMRSAAQTAGVLLVTGDTKVVDKGKGDKIFITTSGIGLVRAGVDISPMRAEPGDVILLSGPIALHGIAIMSVREGLAFESQIRSDSAALNGLVTKILDAGPDVHVLRDPTRGGLASALNEIAESAHMGIALEEDRIPVGEAVKGACEILGLDPLYVANEGKFVAFVAPGAAEGVLAVMKSHPLGADASVIGTVVGDHPGRVVMRTSIGGHRVVDMISGEQLPRIC